MIYMSKVFSESQKKEIERQLTGDHSDKTGIFSQMVRPKIHDLLENWFPRKRELEKLLKPKRKRLIFEKKKTEDE